MRAQFFLDSRDYVKYSLLEDAMQSSGLEQLTMIWMLTPDVENGHGRRQPRLLPARKELNAFFDRSTDLELGQVAEYFRDKGYACTSYGDKAPNYFLAGRRDEYFANVPDLALRRALVFLDPDNGVEPLSTVATTHVRLKELSDLWRRMDGSLLVIYQHKPRVRADVFWPLVASRVEAAIPASVSWLPCGDMGFLLAGSRESLASLASRLNAIGDVKHLH